MAGHDVTDARIVLRPLGLSLPLGVAGLTVASLVLAGLQLGWVGIDESPQVGVALLVSAVPLQALASVLAFLSRDGPTGTAQGLLAVTWLTEGMNLLISAPGATSAAFGLALLSAGVLLIGSAAVAASSKPLIAAVVGLAAIRSVVSAVYQLGGAGAWQDAAGVVSLALVLLGTVTVWTLELRESRRAGDVSEAPGVRPKL